MQVVLAPGETVTFSNPGAMGSVQKTILITRQDEKLTVYQAVDLD
jgi:hypothetical protein